MNWPRIINGFLLCYFIVTPLGRTFYHFGFSRPISEIWRFIFSLIGAFSAHSGSLPEILIATMSGFAYLPIMILCTTPAAFLSRFIRLSPARWIKYAKKNRILSLSILIGTLKEELIWRVALVWLARQMMIGDGIIILTGALCFYGIHWKPQSLVVLMTEIELFIFSLLLYVVYIQTTSLIGVWAIHFLRNTCIFYCRNEIGYAK